MQAMYALKQSETANYHNSIGQLEEVFALDLNSMEIQDPILLEEKKKKATALFESHFNSNSTQENPVEEADIKQAVSDELTNFKNQVEKDKKHFGKMLTKEVDGIFESYLLALSMLDDLAAFSVTEEEERKSKTIKKADIFNESVLNNNQIIVQLRNNKDYQSNTKGGKLVWDSEIIRKVYRNTVRPDEEFRIYADKRERTFEDDYSIALHIAKIAIFKDTTSQTFFEEKDLNWGENKSIVKNMVVKTIKNCKEGEFKLMEISANWEEDKLFYEDLYKYTSQNQENLEQVISGKIENWDIERLAAIDRIILIMAISEMIHFPSIPVKVSINEYIDLSKIYSTPKSKQFINGILDRLAEDLTKSGMIKKSGRGLIDNK